MDFKEILEITAAIATIAAGFVAVSGVAIAWKKKVFHNLHKVLKHHVSKIQKEQSKSIKNERKK